MNGTLPAPAVMLQMSAAKLSNGGLMAPWARRPISVLRNAPPATMAGPVRKPCAMKSRRDTGRLWVSCRIGSSGPSVRGLFLSKYMRFSLLNQRRAAAEDSSARRFHDRTATGGACARGTGDQAIDEARRHVARVRIRHAIVELVTHLRDSDLEGHAGTHRAVDQRIDEQVAVCRVWAGCRAEHRGAGA